MKPQRSEGGWPNPTTPRTCPGLAAALSDLGIRLSGIGRREDALAPTDDAAAIRRWLAEANPRAPDAGHVSRSVDSFVRSAVLAGRRRVVLDGPGVRCPVHLFVVDAGGFRWAAGSRASRLWAEGRAALRWWCLLPSARRGRLRIAGRPAVAVMRGRGAALLWSRCPGIRADSLAGQGAGRVQAPEAAAGDRGARLGVDDPGQHVAVQRRQGAAGAGRAGNLAGYRTSSSRCGRTATWSGPAATQLRLASPARWRARAGSA